MKQPEPMTLELGIRALERERLAFGLGTPSTNAVRIAFEAGTAHGLDKAIRVLQNLDAANQRHGEDPHS